MGAALLGPFGFFWLGHDTDSLFFAVKKNKNKVPCFSAASGRSRSQSAHWVDLGWTRAWCFKG